MKKAVKKAQAELKLDLGCGKNKKEGFIGIDIHKMPGVDAICDLGAKGPWKIRHCNGVAIPGLKKNGVGYMFPDNSVDEIHCSHFLEHLSAVERVRFMNELYRIMKPGAKGAIITPHWCSNRAYGDYTHQWPPVSEMFYMYIRKEWRESQAPHTDIKWDSEGYSCDFGSGLGYGMHPDLIPRAAEYQQDRLMWSKEAAYDIHATIQKPDKVT